MEPGRSYNKEHFRALLQEHGFAPSSYSPVLTRLTQQGDVERVAPGVFKLARSAIEAAAPSSSLLARPRRRGAGQLLLGRSS